MYKIYLNENELILTDTEQLESMKKSANELIAPYSGKTKMLLSYIDMLEKTNRFSRIVIHHTDAKKLLKAFESLYVIVRASGGIVNDSKGRILMIHRRGFWDLPKGKIDQGEKKKAAAIREVEEETGVSGIQIKKKIVTTRHCYRLKNGKRAIKKAFWYAMNAPHQKLTPQLEEDIVKAEWIKLNEMNEIFKNCYSSIIYLIKIYMKKQDLEI